MRAGASEPGWLAPLFCDAQIVSLWSSDAQFAHFIEIEAALAKALHANDVISGPSLAAIERVLQNAQMDEAALAEGMSRDGVVIPVLVAQLKRALPKEHRFLHFGATSQDIQDTATSLTLRLVCDVLKQRIKAILSILSHLQERFGSVQIMGRTRMQAALPIRFSQRLHSWQASLAELLASSDRFARTVFRLQMGGPVGDAHAYGDKADAIAAHMGKTLKLGVPAHSWHNDRQSIVDFGHWLVSLAGHLGKIGKDIALMSQQGVDDIRLSGGGRSSAMAHKQNPIKAEILEMLARYAACLQAGLAQALLHEQERSGVAWMLEWRILPQLCELSAVSLGHCELLLQQIDHVGQSD